MIYSQNKAVKDVYSGNKQVYEMWSNNQLVYYWYGGGNKSCSSDIVINIDNQNNTEISNESIANIPVYSNNTTVTVYKLSHNSSYKSIFPYNTWGLSLDSVEASFDTIQCIYATSQNTINLTGHQYLYFNDYSRLLFYPNDVYDIRFYFRSHVTGKKIDMSFIQEGDIWTYDLTNHLILYKHGSTWYSKVWLTKGNSIVKIKEQGTSNSYQEYIIIELGNDEDVSAFVRGMRPQEDLPMSEQHFNYLEFAGNLSSGSKNCFIALIQGNTN